MLKQKEIVNLFGALVSICGHRTVSVGWYVHVNVTQGHSVTVDVF